MDGLSGGEESWRVVRDTLAEEWLLGLNAEILRPPSEALRMTTLKQPHGRSSGRDGAIVPRLCHLAIRDLLLRLVDSAAAYDCA
jgi:hypothetical protein